jgi:heme-degrading monooxygenase HmoA
MVDRKLSKRDSDVSQRESLTHRLGETGEGMSAAGRFSVHGRITAQPGQREALIERFRDVLEIGIPGLEWCSVSAALDDPDAILMTQIWTDKAAHDAGTRSGAVMTATEHAMSLVGAPLEGSYGQVAYLQDQVH